MNEPNLQILASLKILWLAAFSFLYGWGGISGKWKRRYIGSAWMMLGIFAVAQTVNNWSYWYLLYWPLLVGALSLGYGAETTKGKLVQRAKVGLALGLTPLPLAIINQAWLLLGLHTFLCLAVCIVLGVWNPMRNARDEETAIGTTAGFLPLFMI